MRLLFLTILFWPLYFSEVQNTFIIWNVGQGSWNTYITDTECYHFDMGGEVYATEAQKLCYSKKNYIFVSHWDRDHYKFIPKFMKNVFHVCLKRSLPLTEPKIESKFSALPICNSKEGNFDSKYLKKNNFKEIKNTFSDLRKIAKDRNHSSLIFIYDNILIPGDMTKEVEKIISHKLKNENIKRIILPHHGSITSNSKYFLENLPHATLSIASSRKKKYGHPHREVKKRLKDFSLSLITTEDWGHIRFSF